jgi:hypothetical protein
MNLKKDGEKAKKGFKKFWYLLWNDNSFKGWLFSLIFLFVFIKFIFFPFLNLVTGTQLPLAIVESCSMYHQGNIFSDFNDWFTTHTSKYNNLGIQQEEFKEFAFKKGFDKGDILLLLKANSAKLKVGDIIAFNAGTKGTPVIHRIIKIEEKNGKKIFTTMGDNNERMLTPENNLGKVDEREIKENQLVGKAVIRVAPWLGWVKLIFFEWAKTSEERGFCSER